MKTTFLLSVFCLLILNPSSGAESAGTNKFVIFTVSDNPPRDKVPSIKADLIKDGVTIKVLVELLGPGWMSPNEGIGIVTWFFDDGRILMAWPHYDSPEEPLTFSKTTRPRMWWKK